MDSAVKSIFTLGTSGLRAEKVDIKGIIGSKLAGGYRREK